MTVPAVNWLAVIAAAVVMFILGGLWYSPVLFARRWIALQGRTEEQERAQAAAANMPVMYASAFGCALITAIIMAHILVHMASVMPTGAVHGAFFGLMAWLGFAAPTSYATTLFSGRPKQLWLIDSMYNLVSFVLAGLILAAWR
ncbi:MAG: hypothetical protein QOH22_1746 [Gemmatimonadaceae bacterium]|jgi:fatty acid desaturase|nr:hypothetical protein [Gemmatimonadaceae bacterium]